MRNWFVIYVVLCVAIVACGGTHKRHSEPTMHEKLQDKFEYYQQLVVGAQDEYGFVESDRCDSLLFTALTAVGGIDIDLTHAQDFNGKWYRRPEKDCYEKGESKSTISKDMLVGVMFYAIKQKHYSVLRDLQHYGIRHAWIMGDGPKSRTKFSKKLQKILEELVQHADKMEKPVKHKYSWIPCQGYCAHLQTLEILMLGYVRGEITGGMLHALKTHKMRNPENPLFQYAVAKYTDNDMTPAIEILLNEQYWPSDRLPDNHDRCTEWLLQRDMGDDWKPCPTYPFKRHSGGELLLVASLILWD